MPDIASLENLIRALIVALPILVLIVLFFLLAASRRPQTAAQQDGHSLAGHDPAGMAYAGTASAEFAGRSSASTAPAPPVVPAITPQAALEEAEKLEIDLAAAQEAGETVLLAKLYLALGKARIAAEEEAAGLDALRSAAGLAALYKAQGVHALARIELAEAALRHGDPTTACEHWQMARMAFLEEGAKADGDKIDRRMRAQGCPTDWVLTDF